MTFTTVTVILGHLNRSFFTYLPCSVCVCAWLVTMTTDVNKPVPEYDDDDTDDNTSTADADSNHDAHQTIIWITYTQSPVYNRQMVSTGHVTVCISYTAENIFYDISYNTCNSRHGAFNLNKWHSFIHSQSYIAYTWPFKSILQVSKYCKLIHKVP